MNNETVRKGVEKISIEALRLVASIEDEKSDSSLESKILSIFGSYIESIYRNTSFLVGCLTELEGSAGEIDIERIYTQLTKIGKDLING